MCNELLTLTETKKKLRAIALDTFLQFLLSSQFLMGQNLNFFKNVYLFYYSY